MFTTYEQNRKDSKKYRRVSDLYYLGLYDQITIEFPLYDYWYIGLCRYGYNDYPYVSSGRKWA